MDGVPQNVPTLLEIKRILPKHCFQPSLAKSLYYVAKDLLIVSSAYFLYLYLTWNSWIWTLMAAPFYWYFQGTMFWAIFVLGHDCGHGSFSNYEFINDVIGTFLHR